MKMTNETIPLEFSSGIRPFRGNIHSVDQSNADLDLGLNSGSNSRIEGRSMNPAYEGLK